MRVRAWLTAILLTITTTAFGSEVHLARASWSAFECSALARHMGDSDEVHRLFEYGFRAGKQFLEATEAGRIDNEAAQATVPVGFLWVSAGPTHDFIMGRVYERAVENAVEDVLATTQGLFPDESLRRLRAENGYSSRNCALLGR